MSPVIALGIACGALLFGCVVGYLVARSRHERHLERLAADLQSSVGLYLRRKVAETGLDPTEALRAGSPEAVLRANGNLAEALLEHERRQIELGDTQELSLARTMRHKTPVVSTDVDGQASTTDPDGQAATTDADGRTPSDPQH